MVVSSTTGGIEGRIVGAKVVLTLGELVGDDSEAEEGSSVSGRVTLATYGSRVASTGGVTDGERVFKRSDGTKDGVDDGTLEGVLEGDDVDGGIDGARDGVLVSGAVEEGSLLGAAEGLSVTDNMEGIPDGTLLGSNVIGDVGATVGAPVMGAPVETGDAMVGLGVICGDVKGVVVGD